MTKKLIHTLLVLIYTILPFDLVPDTIIGWGWLDDIALLALLWWFHYRKPASEKTREQSRTRENPEPQVPDEQKYDPYDVLGVPKSASGDDIRRAYRNLANKYHPDKVAHLGEEFGVLAEKRFKEIREAYRTLTSG